MKFFAGENFPLKIEVLKIFEFKSNPKWLIFLINGPIFYFKHFQKKLFMGRVEERRRPKA